MRVEHVSIEGGGKTRDEAMKSIYAQLEQFAPGQRWDDEMVTARPSIMGTDGLVRLWRVEANFERRSS